MKCKNDEKNYYEYKQIVVTFYKPSGNNNRDHQFVLNVFKPIKQSEKIH